MGVELSQEADTRLLVPMLEQTKARYGRLMKAHYVDGGFRSNAGVTEASELGVEIYSPIPTSGSVGTELAIMSGKKSTQKW